MVISERKTKDERREDILVRVLRAVRGDGVRGEGPGERALVGVRRAD